MSYKDHHFALSLIWKIREGLKKAIAPSHISQYSIHFSKMDLIHHFKDEILFNNLPFDNPQRIQVESKHKSIKQLIDKYPILKYR